MMKRCVNMLLFGLVMILGGCAGHVTKAQLSQADYGELSSAYKEAIKEHMIDKFFDPESARYRYIKPPVKGYAYVPNEAPKLTFGYIVDVKINAKNRLGGYTGEGEYTFLVKNNEAWMLHWWTSSGVAP